MESARPVRSEDYTGFSTWLRAAMRRRGYDVDSPRGGGQQQLAADSGLSTGAISKYLGGKSLPRVEEMVKLAGPLETTVREILLRSGRVLEEDLAPETGDPRIDPVVDRIYALEHLPIEVRKARVEDFKRRVEEALRLTEYELEQDLTRNQGE